jgi:chemotaxis protein CheX
MSAEPVAKLPEITEKVWSMMLGFRIRPVEFDLERAETQVFVLGRVTISGVWQGSVMLGCSAALARRAAAAMLGKPPADAEAEEIRDALGELTNMVGGNFKTLLRGDCRLSLPDVVDTVPFEAVEGREHQWFESEGGVLLVAAARKEPSRENPRG